MSYQMFVRRLFQFRGSLPGVRFEARIAILELDTMNMSTAAREVAVVQAPALLPSMSDPLTAHACQVWESEGGALAFARQTTSGFPQAHKLHP